MCLTSKIDSIQFIALANFKPNRWTWSDNVSNDKNKVWIPLGTHLGKICTGWCDPWWGPTIILFPHQIEIFQPASPDAGELEEWATQDWEPEDKQCGYAFLLLRHSSQHQQLKEEKFIVDHSEYFVRGLLASGQEHHGGRTWWTKDVHFMAAGRQSRGTEPE